MNFPLSNPLQNANFINVVVAASLIFDDSHPCSFIFCSSQSPRPKDLRAPVLSGGGSLLLSFSGEDQKNPRVRKILVRNSGAGNGCANFMGT